MAGDNCASLFRGAFWHGACHNANPNGAYLGGANTAFGSGVNWYTYRGLEYSLKFIEMKIRKE
ncbi:hypothetical protein CAPTEDRAFT_144136 [Capitella teleta]|uniref:Fibrinogen C-terminal domain-containing protein n=1 Tax=Capitella teleta TaxID=283909 RepID=R7U243_CAPTE|nr:hypothetical protein CAPTEDRAFT_144136 [Capitella teleta]|eukprot:ELT97240.1 hypothetical protein CAPTEDRAFT_144136 [Capitella teleta]